MSPTFSVRPVLRRTIAVALALLVTIGLVAIDPHGSSGSSGWVPSAHTKLPRHDYKHWKLVFADNFTGHKLGSAWSVYGPTKVPSNPDTAYWSPKHAKVGNGTLTLKGTRNGGKGRIVTAGMGLWGAKPLKYGKVKMLVRVAKCPEVKYAWLLWPYNGEWPSGGEIDFAEDEGGSRAGTTGSVTYASRDGAPAHLPQNYVASHRHFSDWHVVGVEWRRGSIKYTLDGRKWGARKSANIPRGPMVLALQTESLARPGSVPGSFSSCNAQIGWVAEWSPA